MTLRRALLIASALGLAALGAASASVGTHAAAAKTTVNVNEHEFALKLSRGKAPVGTVRLVVHNTGRYAHALAVREGTMTKRTALIKPGKTATLVVSVKKGKLSLWCPQPGHAARGMKTSIVLTTASAAAQDTTTTNDTTTSDTTTETDPIPGY